jgi:hypothetical protein
MDFTEFGWRDGVLLGAAAVGVYLAVALLRLLQLGKRKGHGADAHIDVLAGSGFGPATAPAPADHADLPFSFPSPLAKAAVAVPPGTTFAETLNSTALEHEVRQLRSEVAALREDLLELQATRRVAPQYADAMVLARRGFDVQGIADQCGISLGEAELVLALARDADDPAAEDEYVGIESRASIRGR